MHRGYVTIHRKILDNPIVFKDSDHLAVWVYLLLHATHKKYQALFEGRSIELLPGQLITGRRSIASKLKINENKVQRILELLKNEHLIEQQTSNQNRLLTLVSWSVYQQSEQQNEQRVNNERTTDEQRVNTNNNVNNVETQKAQKKNNNDAGASNYSQDFERFWALYPSKTGKGAAAKKFKKAVKLVDVNILIEAVKNYCEDEKVKKGYICNPETWLHQERWNDEIGKPKPAAPKQATWTPEF